MMESISGMKGKVRTFGRQQGDVCHTEAQTARACKRLGFVPRIALEEGLAREWDWMRDSVKTSD